MFRTKLASKATALFVIAFICLNAGGTMCVAYCQTFDIAAEPEHCPLKKLSEHCDKGEANTHSVANTGEFDCCPMTVSFFAGPIEKNSFSFDSASPSVTVHYELSQRIFVADRSLHSFTHYRGPPLDRRTDRLKFCVLRI